MKSTNDKKIGFSKYVYIVALIIFATIICIIYFSNNEIELKVNSYSDKSNISSILKEYNLYLKSMYTSTQGKFTLENFSANKNEVLYENNNDNINLNVSNIYAISPSLQKGKYKDVVTIENGKLVFDESALDKKEYNEIQDLLDDYYSQNIIIEYNNDDIKLDKNGFLTSTVLLQLDKHKIAIPKGFAVCKIDSDTGKVTQKLNQDEYISYLEENIENGIVIMDENYNEFVFIVVDDVEEMLNGTEGQLYNFSNGTITKIKSNARKQTNTVEEDDMYIGSFSISYESLTDIENELKSYFNQTIASIRKCGGFYIGRYETSVDKDVCYTRMDMNSIGGYSWYDMYSKQRSLSNNYVTSSMIFGCEFDMALRFINTDYIFNSKDRGQYNGNLIKTGSNVLYMEKNIFDLAGNVSEWTIESNSDKYRVLRGGDYFDGRGDSIPVSYRKDSFTPSTSKPNFGSRMQLIVNLVPSN